MALKIDSFLKMKYFNVVNKEYPTKSDRRVVWAENNDSALKIAKDKYGEDAQISEIVGKSLDSYFDGYEYNFYKAKELFHITDEKMINNLYHGNISVGLLKHMISEMEKIQKN